MFNSVLHYMGVHGEVLANMQSLELAQKLLHQGLKRADMRDELFMQLVKQTRGNLNATSKSKAWQLFYLTAATMPPSKDFTSLVSGTGATRGQDSGDGLECLARGYRMRWREKWAGWQWAKRGEGRRG